MNERKGDARGKEGKTRERKVKREEDDRYEEESKGKTGYML